MTQDIKLRLRPGAWWKLAAKCDEATRNGSKGGWPDRLRSWNDGLNAEDFSVYLYGYPWAGVKKLDDITFIQHGIAQRFVGGWQKDCFDIFAGTHPLFTDIKILPKKVRRSR